MGREAKSMSVKMLMLLLKIPMAVKVCLLKHLALGSPKGSQEARMGRQEKAIVPVLVNVKAVRKAWRRKCQPLGNIGVGEENVPIMQYRKILYAFLGTNLKRKKATLILISKMPTVTIIELKYCQ